jgi:hypothetical protein
MPVRACGLYCDGFESYAAGQAPAGSWATLITLGNVSVDATKAYSGQNSVLLSTPVSTLP